MVKRARNQIEDGSNQDLPQHKDAPFERLFPSDGNEAQFAIDAHLYGQPLVLDGTHYLVLRTYTRTQDNFTWLAAVLKQSTSPVWPAERAF